MGYGLIEVLAVGELYQQKGPEGDAADSFERVTNLQGKQAFLWTCRPCLRRIHWHA